MIYSTGTIAISGNTVTGTGTNFQASGSLVRTGCTLLALGATIQAFQITAINSATGLTVTPAASPALAAGTKYVILVSENLSVDGLANNIAETLAKYDANMSGFADVMNSNGNVTITVNGVALTVPGQKNLAQRGSNGAVPITQGGSGATTVAGARTAFGLGSAALKNIGQDNGDVMTMGGSNYWNAIRISSVYDYNTVSAFLSTYQQTTFFPGTGQGTIINAVLEANDRYSSRWIGDTSGVPFFQANVNGTFSDAYKLCAIGKTVTADANGFIKISSPVVKLSGDGRCDANEEAEGVTATRDAEGVYTLRGAAGLHSDGVWQVEIPQDINGNRLCFVDIAVAASGEIRVSVFKRKFDMDSAMIVAGDPMDIPEGRWIDIRLDMPEDSIYNKRMAEADQVLADTAKKETQE